MKSFTIKLRDFFRLNNENKGIDSNFDLNKHQLLIPTYQREYKWTLQKVQVLINDINQRDKFLGIVILDEADECYEIVDGQQRITTCFLALAALYNFYYGSAMEQKSLFSYIAPYNEYILKNDTVGEYLNHNGKTFEVTVDSNNDIYFQKEAFENAYEKIYAFLHTLPVEKVREFKRQLLDCEVLVMINNKHKKTCPVEQIFLDINEKSQLLEVEDIFKGHCFENFDKEYHDGLKKKWTSLKKCGMHFKYEYGFKDVSQYLYLYFLECIDKNIPENLSRNDIHYLEGKSMDETLACLDEMINYGENIISFRENINDISYRFEDLCKNSHEYRDTKDHEFMKIMSAHIIDSRSAQYQKLPFMQFVSFMSNSKKFKDEFTHINFRKAIINLYIYSELFICGGGRKSKKDVDHSVLDALKSNSISGIVSATKKLRTDKCDNFLLSGAAKEDTLRFIYTISDFYISNKTWLKDMYVDNNDYTKEHFLIPDNKGRHITWKKKGESNKNVRLTSKYTSLKGRAINLLIMDRELNEFLEDYDIVTKIEEIRLWYNARKSEIPTHIKVVIDIVESMPEYHDLKDLKDKSSAKESEITQAYMTFLDAYFDKDSENNILLKLSEGFKAAYRNNDSN